MKVTDCKATDLFLARKTGTASANTKVTEHNGVIALELFGNEVAWHYPNGRVDVRVTVASYTTHKRLNALAFKLDAPFCAYKDAHVNHVRAHGVTFSEDDGSTRMVFCLRK